MGNNTSKLPSEHVKHLESLERFRFWTLEAVNQLEKMNANRPISKRPETDKKRGKGGTAISNLCQKRKELTRPSNPFERLRFAFEKYAGNFAGTEFGEALDVFSGTFNKLHKHSIYSQIRAFEEVIVPMKVWVLESYPIILKDMQRCQKLKKSMLQVQKAVAKKPSNKELQKKAQTAKELYDALAAHCNREMEQQQTKLFWHHTMLWQMFHVIQVHHHQFCLLKILKAMDSILADEQQSQTQSRVSNQPSDDDDDGT